MLMDYDKRVVNSGPAICGRFRDLGANYPTFGSKG